MASDALGRTINVGDVVLLAKTGQSQGIHWKRHYVVRTSDKSFWGATVWPYDDTKCGTYFKDELYEDGPYKARNAVKL